VIETPGRFRVLSFDCYGTLIDWETGIWNSLQPLFVANPGREHPRSLVLAQYAEAESAAETLRPNAGYREILRIVHRDLADRLEMETTNAMDQTFSESVGDWPPFADSREALAKLGDRFKLVILSNVDRLSFAISQKRLGVEFDAIYTAEDIGSYKPDPSNFEYLIEHVRQDFGVGRAEILHVAQSLYHDHVPGIAAGLATAWIDRQRLSAGGDWGATATVDDPPEPSMVFFTMGELASALVS
jgi:2-haloalkanoic acid dehalogenase type II